MSLLPRARQGQGTTGGPEEHLARGPKIRAPGHPGLSHRCPQPRAGRQSRRSTGPRPGCDNSGPSRHTRTLGALCALPWRHLGNGGPPSLYKRSWPKTEPHLHAGLCPALYAPRARGGLIAPAQLRRALCCPTATAHATAALLQAQLTPRSGLPRLQRPAAPCHFLALPLTPKGQLGEELPEPITDLSGSKRHSTKEAQQLQN